MAHRAGINQGGARPTGGSDMKEWVHASIYPPITLWSAKERKVATYAGTAAKTIHLTADVLSSYGITP